MSQTIGLILFVVVVFSPLMAFVGHDVYWFLQCYRHGGDWEYYALRLVVVFWVLLCGIAFTLLLM